MPLLTDWNINLSSESVLKGINSHPNEIIKRNPEIPNLVHSAVKEARNLIKPVLYYRQLKVEKVEHNILWLENNKFLQGDVIVQNLACAENVLAAVCTIGPGLEQRASEVEKESPLHGYVLNNLCTVAIDILYDQALQFFEKQAASQGMRTSPCLSPGMEGWPVDRGQPQIFKLLKDEKPAVQLTSSKQMIPLSSVSFVIGVGKDLAYSENICAFCNLRDRCSVKASQTS